MLVYLKIPSSAATSFKIWNIVIVN